MTISATTDAFMKYQILKPLASVIVGPVNGIITIEMQTSFRGITLTADDVVIQKHKPGTDPSAYPITFISVATKADGKTLDVKWQAADTMIGPFTFYVLRKKATGLVEGEDWVQVDMELRFGISGLRIGPIHDSSEHIRGHQGELINGWFTVYNDGVPIKLNDPGLTLTLQAAANINVITDVIAIDERFEDHITFKIKGKPSGIDVNEPAGTATGYFYIKATWKGVTAQVMPTLTWYPSTDMISSATIQQPLFPNQTQKAVTQFGPVNGNGIAPWYTIEGATVRAGSIFVNQFDGSGVVQQVVVNPGTPLNSINQLVKEITASWMKQRVTLSGFVLDLPFITDRTLYQTMWRLNAETTIEMAPIEFEISSEVITGVAQRTPSVYITAQQMRDGELVQLNGRFSSVTVAGAAAYASMYTLDNRIGLINMTSRGVSGDVFISGTFTSSDSPVLTQNFSFTIKADNTLDIEMPYQLLPAKIWDTFTDFPVIVKSKGVDVSTNVIDFKIIDNNYVKSINADPYSWEIFNAIVGTAARVNTYFMFSINIDGYVHNLITYLDYSIASWDGITLKPNAEYIPGDRVSKNPKVPLGGTYTYTFYPEYKGKLDLENIELRTITRTGIVFLGQRVNDEGTGIVVTLGIATDYTTASITFYYQVKGIPLEELVNQKTVVSETVTLTAIQKGLYVESTSPFPSYGGVGRTRTWRPAVYFDAIRLKLDDPRLDYVIEDHPNQAKFIEYAGSDATTVYLFTYKAATGSASWYQLATIKYTDSDGVVHSSGPTALTIGFSSEVTTVPTMTVTGSPVPNAENILPVKFHVGENPPFSPPNLLGRANVKVTPFGSDAAINGVEYLSTGALKFDSGWEGGDIFYLGTWAFPDVYSTQPVIIKVPPAPVVVTRTPDNVNGGDGAATEITFTLSQERLINGSVTSYTFADATVSNNVNIQGPVGKVDTIVNENGTFTAKVYGTGAEGQAILTFTVTDSLGKDYSVPVILDVNIDSSNFILTLDKDSISGKKGARERFSGTLTFESSNISMKGPVWTIEPAGWGVVNSEMQNSIVVEITRSVPADESQECKIVCNWYGYKAESPLTINVEKNLDIVPKVYDTKVWDRIEGYPFVLMEGETDVTNTVLDCKPVNDSVIIPIKMKDRNTPAVNMWTVKGEGVMPARTEIVTWEYRLPSDAPGIKRTIDVTYNVAAFNGHELSFIPSAVLYRTVYNGSFQADFYIYRKAEPATETPTNLGTLIIPCVNQEGYTSFPGQGRLTLRGKNVELYDKPNTWSIRVNPTGNVLGKDTIVVTLMISIYNANIPTGISDFNPNPLVGKFGEEYQLNFKVWRNGLPSDLMQAPYTDLLFYPQGILESVPGSKTKDGFKVRFLKDIDVNTVTTTLDARLNVTGETQGRGALTVTQQAVSMKLTAAPGFESTGSGDMENPVTLKQGVLNPE